jgi:hypothetical protein
MGQLLVQLRLEQRAGEERMARQLGRADVSALTRPDQGLTG